MNDNANHNHLPSRPAPRHFNLTARVLHWSMALMILAMLFIGIGMVASLSLRPTLISLHRPLGIAILLLVIVRLINRLRHRPPPLPADLPAGTISAEVVPTGADEPVVIGPHGLHARVVRQPVYFSFSSSADIRERVFAWEVACMRLSRAGRAEAPTASTRKPLARQGCDLLDSPRMASSMSTGCSR